MMPTTDRETAVNTACEQAAAAFDEFRSAPPSVRAGLLDRIAVEIEAIGDELIATAAAESHLPEARITGERGRTVGQLRLFADEVRAGRWLRLRIDHAQPDRQPLPRPDLRLRMVPVGPVAVFGASNFPLAFSTAGGDTASALAAGCPVVVKGHPAHPRTSELVAAAVTRAVAACGLPAGVFGHVTGEGNAVGAALVRHPAIAAVAFTGSRAGGLALTALARARDVPIPVFAEMSSINPVVLLPAALAARPQALAEAFVGSLTLGAGQFCTNPGLILAIAGPDLDAFAAAAGAALGGVAPQRMLTEAIGEHYAGGVAALTAHRDVTTVATGQVDAAGAGMHAALFRTTADAFENDAALAAETFGAAGLIVDCADADQLMRLLSALEGQLTATLQLDDADGELAARLVPLLERKAGRLLVNGWPTGVEVAPAMVHGGPFPATSDGRSTSVGTLAVDRFLRPVCYQNMPASLLPPELRDGPDAALPRLVDGETR